MANVFFLASDLGDTGPARQLVLTAPGLVAAGHRVAVGVIGGCGPAAAALRTGGISVTRLPVRSPLDLGGMRSLRRAVAASGADVIHAVGSVAVRETAVLPRGGPPVVASAAGHPGGGPSGWVARRQLRRAVRVAFGSDAEADRYRRLGVAADRLVPVPPAAAPPDPPPDGTEFRRSLDIPPHARLIFAAGRLDRVAGLRDAVWAFDTLRYDADDLFLVVVGGGPDRGRLEAFGRSLGFDDFRVRFAGRRADLPAVLGLASAVWVTHARGGVNVALEAMAAGRPVLGWRTADLAGVVRDGETGRLVRSGSTIELASQTRAVLDDPALAAKFGDAGRRDAVERYAVGPAVAALAGVYAGVVGRPPAGSAQ